jgi:hypothetical protein
MVLTRSARVCAILATLGAMATESPPAAAQSARESNAFVNQQRAVRDQIWAQIDDELSPAQQAAFDYGGSLSFNLFIYDDGIDSSRTFRRSDLRVWTRLTLDEGAHEFFARVRTSYLDFNRGDSFDGDDDDWEGPNLERGYYQFDLRKARRAAGWGDIHYDLRVKLGRDLVEFGTGLALWQVLDHVAVAWSYEDWAATGLIGRTVGSQFDFDRSRPIDRSRRAFFGAQLDYRGFERHRPFAYVLWQRDHNEETVPSPLQQFDYDSFYVGLGSRGELVKNLRYETEWVYESGRSYGNRRFLRQDVIRAWAFDMELEYLFEHRTRPRLSLEYIFASGDPDRLASPTNSIGGNRGDATDRGFNAFGYRDTGLSFAPVLSNIHVWRAGASCYPFAGDRTFDRLELGTNWFLYWKNRRDAAVSDITATEQSGYLGWEMDYYANWQVTNDLFWTVRSGVFFPGSAFSDQTTRTFVLTGFTWSF